MAISLTTAVSVGNGSRLTIKARLDEDNAQIDVTVQLRTAVGTDLIHSERMGAIRNGQCDRFVRATLSPGRKVLDALDVEIGKLSKPTGFTDALVAYRVNRAAFEAHLLSAGYIDSSLAGT